MALIIEKGYKICLGKLLGSCWPEALHHSITFTNGLVGSSPWLTPNMSHQDFSDTRLG